MLGKRRRRWPNIKSTSDEHIVAIKYSYLFSDYTYVKE